MIRILANYNSIVYLSFSDEINYNVCFTIPRSYILFLSLSLFVSSSLRLSIAQL